MLSFCLYLCLYINVFLVLLTFLGEQRLYNVIIIIYLKLRHCHPIYIIVSYRGLPTIFLPAIKPRFKRVFDVHTVHRSINQSCIFRVVPVTKSIQDPLEVEKNLPFSNFQ